MVQRSVYLSAILALTFLTRQPFEGARKDRLTIWLFLDIVLAFASIFCAAYIVCDFQGIF